MANLKHGLSTSRFYHIWKNLKARCNNKNNQDYFCYGGRGIKVCDRWKIFQNFKNDMYHSYTTHLRKYGTKNTTIDRINYDDDYSPQNCRWANPKQQANNRRNARLFRGKTLTEWSLVLKINRSTLSQRYYVYHWPIDKVLSTQANKQ